ncbi:hypothetical protein KBB05_03335 [Patescibacteria group bacterium]|nr:hypothetical protein [Patescibacteria group bacterium]
MISGFPLAAVTIASAPYPMSLHLPLSAAALYKNKDVVDQAILIIHFSLLE